MRKGITEIRNTRGRQRKWNLIFSLSFTRFKLKRQIRRTGQRKRSTKKSLIYSPPLLSFLRLTGAGRRGRKKEEQKMEAKGEDKSREMGRSKKGGDNEKEK